MRSFLINTRKTFFGLGIGIYFAVKVFFLLALSIRRAIFAQPACDSGSETSMSWGMGFDILGSVHVKLGVHVAAAKVNP